MDQQDCDALADQLSKEPVVGMDLEFVSDDCYRPKLALVQLSWEQEGNVQCVAVDPLEVDVSGIAKICSDPSVCVLLHGGKQDLQILNNDFDVQPKNVVDLQIAAAFCGIADQIGYANLVDKLLKKHVDKDAQHTDWLKRPLSEKQKIYALGDVEYLIPMWRILKEKMGRKLEWFESETQTQAEQAVFKAEPRHAYQKCRGWQKLSPKRLGILANLAEWRLQKAAETNKPLSWIVSDHGLMDLVKKRPKSTKDLTRFKNLKRGQVEKHGTELIEVLGQPPSEGPFLPSLNSEPLSDWQTGQVYGVLGQLYFAACKESLSPKLLGSRKDVEEFIRLDKDKKTQSKFLLGWRFQLAGQKLLSWLEENPEPKT